jgi:ribosomal-protein-alanine N-acetyltransferase
MLTTERLTLRTIDPILAPRVADFLVRNRAFHRPWDPVVEEIFFTPDFQWSKLEGDLSLMLSGQSYRFWMFAREDQALKRILGYVSLSNIVRGAFQSCFLGYKLDQAATNRGFMTEGVREVVRYAFDELKLHRIEANIIPRNTASLRVVEKLGFVNEGLSRKYLKINGVWEDHLHYVVLNPAIE